MVRMRLYLRKIVRVMRPLSQLLMTRNQRAQSLKTQTTLLMLKTLTMELPKLQFLGQYIMVLLVRGVLITSIQLARQLSISVI